MASKTKRHKARNKRRHRNPSAAPEFDLHARYVVDSMESLDALVARFAVMDDPVEEIGAAFDAAVATLVDDLRDFEPHRLIEVARMAYLPWARPGQVTPTPEATAAHVELLALIAFAAAAERAADEPYPVARIQEMSHFVTQAAEQLNSMLQLSHLRAVAAADPTDQLTMVALMLRGQQVLIRHTSYAEMVEETVTQLVDGNADVQAVLIAELGFDGSEAIKVLSACHEVQQDKLNLRARQFADAMDKLMPQLQGDGPAGIKTEIEKAIGNLFEPDFYASTVGLADLVATTGLQEDTIRAVIDRFFLHLEPATPQQVVDDFMRGRNPMRTHPVIGIGDERVMLPHNVLTVDAVKENLEDFLKQSSVWNVYVKHRGDLLESRTRLALARVLPGAIHRDGFEYYVPATGTELATGDPEKYTKRVEGDHLVVLDDVALIVEDKAVALSALSKGGKTQRLRTDLTGIVSKAADQAGRLRDVIERDGGVRIEGEGWVDFSYIREIHTVAGSLDDLVSITTATAELVRVGILDPTNVPWTVSLHDLELITSLAARPAEFLLYLRRRRNPDVTVMFSAADELDLFLYFFEGGLWVEPDPDQVREIFPWLGASTTAERRRFHAQMPVYLTSRTDPLDAWYQAGLRPEVPAVPKPAMVVSPLADLVDALQARGDFGWLSIGAILLASATGAQHELARIPGELLNAPLPDRGRSQTVPMVGVTNATEAWLMVWGTRPAGQAPSVDEKQWKDYLRSKKHQLGIPRGFALVYDEGTRGLSDVYYDGHIGDLSADLSARLASLRPPASFHGRLHPNAKRAPGRRGRKSRNRS